jgi:putative DNA primase/helicase
VEKLTKTDQRVSVTSELWDQNLFLLGTPGGTVDLKTGELRKPDRADFITKQTAVTPDETASCPQFLQFLHGATLGDVEKFNFLQRFFGYALTGSTKEEVLAFAHGPGGNGKSVLSNGIAYTMGDYATTAAMETFMASKWDRHPTELAMLRGARFVQASETEEGRKWATSRVKQLTGSDPVTARFMRQNHFTYLPQFTLYFSGNSIPQLENVDDAIRRRFLIIPFTNKPKKIDRLLGEKLRAEAPGILRWMIDGTLDWQKEGLNPPESILATTQKYFEQEDVFGQWIEECCEVGSDKLFPVVAAFNSWKIFAVERGHEPGTPRTFAPKLRHQGFVSKPRNIKGKPTKVWVGIDLCAG